MLNEFLSEHYDAATRARIATAFELRQSRFIDSLSLDDIERIAQVFAPNALSTSATTPLPAPAASPAFASAGTASTAS